MLEGFIRRGVGIRGGINGRIIRIESRLCDSGFEFLTIIFLKAWSPASLLPENSMEECWMNHILQRLIFLWFAVEVDDIVEGTSYLGVLLLLPDVGYRWLVRVSDAGTVIEILKWGVVVSAFLRVNLLDFLRLNLLRFDFLKFDCLVWGHFVRSDFLRRVW